MAFFPDFVPVKYAGADNFLVFRLFSGDFPAGAIGAAVNIFVMDEPPDYRLDDYLVWVEPDSLLVSISFIIFHQLGDLFLG